MNHIPVESRLCTDSSLGYERSTLQARCGTLEDCKLSRINNRETELVLTLLIIASSIQVVRTGSFESVVNI